MAYYKMSCPLCKYNVPVINEFLYKSLEKICTQVPMDQLFVLAHQAYGEFVKSSKMHGKKVLDISIEQIRKQLESEQYPTNVYVSMRPQSCPPK